MNTLEGTLRFFGFGSLRIGSRSDAHELTVDATSMVNTISVSHYAIHDYHPIAALVGKYSNDPLWNELEEVMTRNRELDRTNEHP